MFSQQRVSRPRRKYCARWKVQGRMAATNVELATQIERTLNSGLAIGSGPGAARELKQLHDLLATWNAGPEAAGGAATEVKKILAQGITPQDEQAFRAALGRLQSSLKATGSPANIPEENQLANDPELVQEFLVEA